MPKREAMLYEQIQENKVRCNLCARRCVISDGGIGFCGVRRNEGGRLYSLNYAKACAANIDPIGKKPLSHFHPGALVMSIATVGCNFRCQFCLDGETLIPLVIDGKLKLVKAKELDSFFREEEDFVNTANYGLCAIGLTGLRRIVAISRRKPDASIYEIFTERGKSVKLTGDHRLIVWNSDEACIKKASEVKVKDIIRTGLNNLPINTGKIMHLNLALEMMNNVPADLLKHIYISDIKALLNKIRLESRLTFKAISDKIGIKHRAYYFSRGIMPISAFAKLIELFNVNEKEILNAQIKARGSPYQIPAIFPLTPRFMRLLGYFIAKGNYNGGYNLALTSKNGGILRDMEESIRGSFATFMRESKPGNGVPRIIFGGKLIHLMFRFILKVLSDSKSMRLPDLVFNLPKNLLKEFLSGYMTGDGALYKRESNDEVWVRFVTASETLKTQLCFLLSMNGIQYSVEMLEHHSPQRGGRTGVAREWRINIRGYENLRRLNEIAAFLDERQRIMESYLKDAAFSDESIKDFEEIKEIRIVDPTHIYVYDITLEGNGNLEDHAFFVNEGILIHNCDNWAISQEKDIVGRDFTPEEVVKATLEHGCQGISYTYTEPTIFFEYAYDTAVEAHKHGLFNTFVTNGYMTPEAVRAIAPYLDAATVDFKGGGDPEFYRKFSMVPSVEPIYEALKEMKRHGIHIEVTNLVVPKIGDSMEKIEELASWIKENLGEDTPLHLLRFHPDYKLTTIPSTEIRTLEKAYESAKKAGLNYVYLGNVPGHRYEDTYCPSCQELLIKRYGFEVIKWNITGDMRCPKCGHKIAIKGRFHRTGLTFPYSII